MIQTRLISESPSSYNNQLNQYKSKTFFGKLIQQGFTSAEDEELTKRTFSKSFRMIGGGDANHKIYNTGLVNMG